MGSKRAAACSSVTSPGVSPREAVLAPRPPWRPRPEAGVVVAPAGDCPTGKLPPGDTTVLPHSPSTCWEPAACHHPRAGSCTRRGGIPISTTGPDPAPARVALPALPAGMGPPGLPAQPVWSPLRHSRRLQRSPGDSEGGAGCSAGGAWGHRGGFPISHSILQEMLHQSLA